jgi:AmmeMemoRadiSam system protein B
MNSGTQKIMRTGIQTVAAAALIGAFAALRPSPAVEPTGAGQARELENLLDGVVKQHVPGDLQGILVPARVDAHGLKTASYGYAPVRRTRFDTVLFLYTAPALEEEGVVMPASPALDTPFGSLRVDEELRAHLAASTGAFRISDSAHRWSETVRVHMNFLHKVARNRKLRVLPLAVAVSDWDRAKTVPIHLMRSLSALERKRHRVLVLIAADLSRGFPRKDAVYHDGRLLSFLETLSADGLLRYMEDASENPGPSVFPDAGPLVAGVLTLNQLLANRGDALLYANSGQFPVAKKEESLRSTGMAAVAFSHGKTRGVRFSKDRTRKIAKHISERLLANLLKQARLAVGLSLDPAAESLRPAEDESAQEPFPVFVSLFRDGRLIGQSGTIEAQGPLEEAVRFHAVKAASQGTAPLKKEDLPQIVIGIDIPSRPQKVDFEEVIPALDGVVLDCMNRRNIFLPEAWRRYPNRAVFLSELTAQAGFDPWRWNAKRARLSAFQVLSLREGDNKAKEEQEREQREKQRQGGPDASEFEYFFR